MNCHIIKFARVMLVATLLIASVGSLSLRAKIMSPEKYTEWLTHRSDEQLKHEFLQTQFMLLQPIPTEIQEGIKAGVIEPDIVTAHSLAYKRKLFQLVRDEMKRRNLIFEDIQEPSQTPANEQEPVMPNF